MAVPQYVRLTSEISLKVRGIEVENLQSCLNLFVYLLNIKRDDEKYPKVERVITHTHFYLPKKLRMFHACKNLKNESASIDFSYQFDYKD